MTDKKEILMTPNSIARGSYSIGEKENNLFLKLMYSVQKENRNYLITRKRKEELDAEELAKWQELCKIETLEARITRADILEIFKNKNDRTPEGMDAIFKALRECEIRFKTVTREGVDAVLVATLINHYYIEETTGDYLVIVPAKLYRYLFDLGLGYTQNALQIIYSLGGLYSRRLYLIFRSLTGFKKADIELTVEQLRDMLQLGSKNKTYNSFETNVLKRAMDEINKSGKMEIKIKDKIKKGRSVHSIIFTVKDNEPRNYLEEFKKAEPQAPATKEPTEPIEWTNGIMVADKRIYNTLEAMYGDIKNGIARNILKKAYIEFINSDKYGETVLDKKGIVYYMPIADRLLKEHEEKTLGIGQYEPNYEAELYGSAPADTTENETTATIYTEERQETQEQQEPQAPADTEELDAGYMDLQNLLLGRK